MNYIDDDDLEYIKDMHNYAEKTKKTNERSTFCCLPPFYIYKKSDLELFKKGIDGGCKTDAPGSFIEWLC